MCAVAAGCDIELLEHFAAHLKVRMVTPCRPRDEHDPQVLPDSGLRFEDVDDSASDSGIEHLLD